MGYLSLTFVAFVAITAFLYFGLPKIMRGGVLLVASLFFYACFDWRYLIFLLFTAFTTYVGALILRKTKFKKFL